MRSMVSLEALPGRAWSPEFPRRARPLAIAPNYSLAHAALACELATLYFSFGGAKDESLAREARVHAERALLLVANDPIAHVHGRHWPWVFAGNGVRPCRTPSAPWT